MMVNELLEYDFDDFIEILDLLQNFIMYELCLMNTVQLYEKYPPVEYTDTNIANSSTIIYEYDEDGETDKKYCIVVGFHIIELKDSHYHVEQIPSSNNNNNNNNDTIKIKHKLISKERLEKLQPVVKIELNEEEKELKNKTIDSIIKFNKANPENIIESNKKTPPECKTNYLTAFKKNVDYNIKENTYKIEDLEVSKLRKIQQNIKNNTDDLIELYTNIDSIGRRSVKPDKDIKFSINLLKHYVDEQVLSGKDIKDIRRDFYKKVRDVQDYSYKQHYLKTLEKILAEVESLKS